MTIDKAIEVLETEAHLAERQPETGIYDALKLGIEALRRLEELRTPASGDPLLPLPGETES